MGRIRTGYCWGGPSSKGGNREIAIGARGWGGPMRTTEFASLPTCGRMQVRPSRYNGHTRQRYLSCAGVRMDCGHANRLPRFRSGPWTETSSGPIPKDPAPWTGRWGCRRIGKGLGLRLEGRLLISTRDGPFPGRAISGTFFFGPFVICQGLGKKLHIFKR